MPRYLVVAGLAAWLSLGFLSAAFAQNPHPSAAKQNAEGDPNGAIRALGAAGYNAHHGKPSSAVDIPPLDTGRSERGGLPYGTTGGRLRR